MLFFQQQFFHRYNLRKIKQNRNRKLLWFCLFFFKKSYPPFPLFTLFIETFFPNVAPGRGAAAEEFCVFGDWGGSLNKPEKPERSGGFFANGAPYALLATFVERAIWRATCIACQIYLSKKFSQFVRQNAPACHITPIERSCKNSSPYFGLFESSCHITYMRGFLENSPDKNETKTPLVSYQYYEEKNILKNLKQNRDAVSLQHNRGVSKIILKFKTKRGVCVATT